MQNNAVVCNNLLIVGDLHFDDTFQGRHKNYVNTCLTTLKKIEERIDTSDIGCLVLLGDLVGVSSRNVKSREILSILCSWFKKLKDRGVRVISVRGNHDFGDYPDFEFLVSLGLIETSQTLGGYFDYYGSADAIEPEVRFHLVDYGMEGRKLDILTGGQVTNIALTHNNFTIQGVTNWYQAHDGIELANQTNFNGIYMVINGHIHAPSPEIAQTDAVWGQPILLFDLGCPTRPALEKYTSCWFMEFNYKAGEGTSFNAVPFELQPLEDEYFLDDDDLAEIAETQEQVDEKQRVENLHEILGEIMACRISSGDLTEQISRIPNASEDAKNLAISYLQKAILEVK